jgi:hypothetical protein
MIYTKILLIYIDLVYVLRWNPPELPRTIGSISSVPIYTITSSLVGALIMVVCGPTWTNQWMNERFVAAPMLCQSKPLNILA